MRKAQVTVFILLGVVVLLAFGIAFYYQPKQPSVPQLASAAIQRQVSTCIAAVGKQGLLLAGRQGGYTVLPSDSASGSPLYVSGSRVNVPSLETIGEQLAAYMNANLPICLQGVLEPSQRVARTTAIIGPDNIAFKVDFPVSVARAGFEQEIEQFAASVGSVRLVKFHDIAKNFSAQSLNGACITCLAELASANNAYADIRPLDKSTTLYIITGQNDTIDGTLFAYEFAHRYS
ncbi:hypothetical protein HY642_02255 [Candidatus Woesearchaeota archaeon]|nr:hypothetical protein [Candidatus Woesearchaeota archaeon]